MWPTRRLDCSRLAVSSLIDFPPLACALPARCAQVIHNLPNATRYCPLFFFSLLSHSTSCKKAVAEVESAQVWSDRNFSLQEVVLRHVGKCIYELCCLSPPGISINMRSSFWMTLCRWVEHHLIVVFVFTCILLLYHHPWTSYPSNSGLSAADVHLGTNIYITVYVVWFMYTVYTVLLLCRNT